VIAVNDVRATPMPQLDSKSQFPLFSVIVPFEDHRGQWEQCIRAWQSQTLPGSQFELILVMPPGLSAALRSMLPALVRPQDRIEYTEQSHDIALCEVGGKIARGQFLFFTEAHCWPEPGVLEKCLKKFAAEPDLAGFSCRSLRVAQGRLSNTEADMYESEIEFGLTVHPWRKILDQCFVTRRNRYEQAGGFNAEYGHFSEWILAANYFALGHRLGYEHDARFYHYYIGDLARLREFTRDFVDGEIRYFAQGPSERGSHLFDGPPEWICQGRWNRRLAQGLVRIAVRCALDPSIDNLAERPRWAAVGMRWLALAILGVRASRGLAECHILLAYMRLRCTVVISPKARLDEAFKNYVSALVHHQRIVSIMALAAGAHRTGTEVLGNRTVGWDAFAPENAGFHLIEVYQGHEFRWSEDAAIVEGWMPIGRHEICIDCVPVRPLDDSLDLRIYFNQHLVSAGNVRIDPHRINITLEVATSGRSTLAWMCRAFPAIDDPRLLGLPIRRIDCAGFDASPRPGRAAAR
jgi:hypothetical protein